LVEKASSLALKKGVLASIPTETQRVTDSGLTFLVRVAEILKRKPAGSSGTGEKSDPFHEPEKSELFVETLSPTHSLLLNKFNVVPNHVLVVTNQFRPQTEPLDTEDFLAMWRCMLPLDAMAFYNCGPNSGAR